jgi:hypothetical protein
MFVGFLAILPLFLTIYKEYAEDYGMIRVLGFRMLTLGFMYKKYNPYSRWRLVLQWHPLKSMDKEIVKAWGYDESPQNESH